MTGIWRSLPLERAEHLEAVHPRHLEIEDDAVDRRAAERLERLRAARRGDHLVAAEPPQVVGVLLGHRGHVVHHQHQRHRAAPPAGPAGSSTVTRVPTPGSVSTRASRRDRGPAAGRSRGRARCRRPWWCRSRRRRGRAGPRHPGPVSATVTGRRALAVAGALSVETTHLAALPRDAVDRVADQVLEDPPQHEPVGGGRRERRSRAGSARWRPRPEARTTSQTSAFTSQTSRRPRARAGRSCGPASRDRRRSTPASPAARRRRCPGLRPVARHLVEVAEHVPDRREAVLDVVIHLARQVAQRDPALRLAEPHRAGAEPPRHRAEQAGERADLVRPVGGEVLVQPVEVDRRGLVGELAERAAHAAARARRRAPARAAP